MCGRNSFVGMLAIVCCAVLLAGCETISGLNREASLASTCSAYASSLSAVTPFKAQMTEGQVEAVDAAVDLLGPVCRKASEGGEVDERVLDAAEDALRRLLLVKQGIS